jgi:anti-sigma B factor antagonist
MNTTEPLTITVQHTAPGRIVRQAADEALAAVPQPQCLTLDFTGVDACDSSGLSALIWIKRCTVADGVRLHLVGFDAHQHEILQITGLDAYLADALNAPCQEHAEETATASVT